MFGHSSSCSLFATLQTVLGSRGRFVLQQCEARAPLTEGDIFEILGRQNMGNHGREFHPTTRIVMGTFQCNLQICLYSLMCILKASASAVCSPCSSTAVTHMSDDSNVNNMCYNFPECHISEHSTLGTGAHQRLLNPRKAFVPARTMRTGVWEWSTCHTLCQNSVAG